VLSRPGVSATPERLRLNLRLTALVAVAGLALALAACGSGSGAHGVHDAAGSHARSGHRTAAQAKAAATARAKAAATAKKAAEKAAEKAAVAADQARGTTTTVAPGVTATTRAGTATTTSPTGAGGGPTPDQVQIAEGGCAAMEDLSDVISEAADENSAQPLQAMENTDPNYGTIVNLGLLNDAPSYQKLGTDAGPVASDFSSAIQSNDLSTVEQLATTLTSDCTALGFPTGDGN